MRINRLELRGFKSFADPTVFRFGPGIAAVVGPNGCGKSNLIDAIRWTLGEQSASALRGRAMSDVIFAGSESRAPANVAEVTVVFDNGDGAFGGRLRRYSEIEVSRRLDRAGTSSYAINRQRGRLKDVTDLFLDTGVGARAYSIIEQGRVGFVVNARPEERRVLIDEVAGINRFKGQRAEAERRLEGTRANLLRVADLAGELGRQRKGLEAQALKADRFMELRAAWKDAALRALLGEALANDRGLAEATERMAAVVAQEREASARVSTAGAAEIQAREAAETARAAAEEHRVRDGAVQVRLAAGLKEAEARQDEAAGLARRQVELESLRLEARNEATSLAGALESARLAASSGKEQLAGALLALQGAEAEDAARRQAAQGLHARVEAAKAALLTAMTHAARHRNSVTLLHRRIEDARSELTTESRAQASVVGRLDELDARWVKAGEAVTEAEQARAAMRSRREAADQILRASQREAADRTRAAEESRVQVRALEVRAGAEERLVRSLDGFEPGLRALVAWAQGSEARAAGVSYLGVVADLLDVPAAHEAHVERWLGDLLAGAVFADESSVNAAATWLLARDLGSVPLVALGSPPPAGGLAAAIGDVRAPGLAARCLGPVSIDAPETLRLDEEGPAVSTRSARRDGTLRVGRVEVAATGQLARRRALRDLQDALAAALADALVTQALRVGADAAADHARAERDRLAAAGHESELAELASRRDRDEADRARTAVREESARARERAARLESQIVRLSEELARAEAALERAERDRAVQEGAIGDLRGGVVRAEADAGHSGRSVTAATVALSEARHGAAVAERDARRLEAERDVAARRVAQADGQLAASSERLAELSRALETLENQRTQLEGEARELGAAGPELIAARARAATEARDAAVVARTAEQELADVGRSVAAGRIQRAQADERLRSTSDRVAREFDLDLRATLVSLGEEAAELERDRATNGRRAAQIEAEIERLGPVNLEARKEFDELDARWSLLDAQQQDLQSAVTDLARAIGEIERETRSRFVQAFEAVARHFAALYPKLVGGGRGVLRLSEPDDPLGSGVDVHVEPPGKRLQNLQLLSGGEKAMAAIALVFAVFQVKPSPFCLLDEVDAPLDEANSRRFNGMLTELAAGTQFVVITHNRTTMEVADQLLGVTMQEPGASNVVSVQLDEL